MTEPEEPDVDADVFPALIPADPDDPLGIQAAVQIANQVAGIPTSVRRKRYRPPTTDQVQFSASGPSNRDPRSLSSAFGALIENRGWRTEIGVRRLLIDAWPKLVGHTNAQHSSPVSFTDHVLYVQAESTTWATVLRQLAPRIVAKLNAELGDGSVTRIEVRGPAAPNWRHGSRVVRDGRGPRDTYG